MIIEINKFKILIMSKFFNKLKIFVILLTCYLQAILFGKAKKNLTQPKKILIIQTASLGDMVCATPVFHAVKKQYSDCQITVMGNKPNQELLANNLDVDEYVLLNIKNNFWQEVKNIKTKNFDFACLIFPDFYALALLFLANIKSICAPKIIGYSPYNSKAYRLLLPLVNSRSHYVRQYAARQYLKMLEPINIFATDTKKYLSYSAVSEQKIVSFFKENNINDNNLIVCVVPTAGNKIKEWPAEKFVQIINYLKEKYQAKIIITAAPSEQETVQEVLRNLKLNSNVFNFVGDVEELKALIAKTKLYISVDTGPIYIAEAFDIPTIDILGPVDENDQPPVGPKNLIVKAQREKSETCVMNSRKYNRAEALRQVNDITVEMVQEKIDSIAKILKF